jgi:hypothetical protein
LCRVVLGGFLQPLNGGISLLVQLLEEVVGVSDAVVEVARKRIADAVDAANGQKMYREEDSLSELTAQVHQQQQFLRRFPSSASLSPE